MKHFCTKLPTQYEILSWCSVRSVVRYIIFSFRVVSWIFSWSIFVWEFFSSSSFFSGFFCRLFLKYPFGNKSNQTCSTSSISCILLLAALIKRVLTDAILGESHFFLCEIILIFPPLSIFFCWKQSLSMDWLYNRWSYLLNNFISYEENITTQLLRFKLAFVVQHFVV